MAVAADPKVAIIYGSPSDANVMSKAGAMLDRFGVGYEEVSISAHRAPRALVEWISGLAPRGIEVIIAGAGLSAALPGVCAAHTSMPVIGVPIKGGALDGLDALLAISQMPPGRSRRLRGPRQRHQRGRARGADHRRPRPVAAHQARGVQGVVRAGCRGWA